MQAPFNLCKLRPLIEENENRSADFEISKNSLEMTLVIYN